MSEFAPAQHRGFYAALPFAGCIIGILLAGAMFTWGQHLPKDDFYAYGWRIPSDSALAPCATTMAKRRTELAGSTGFRLIACSRYREDTGGIKSA